ncbi:MAG: carboxylesterase/lipase family protein [Candidatus Thorarchaeota archaeon]
METVITTRLGEIRGTQRENYLEFLGIRYAEPPVGERRFTDPFPVERWDGVYDATRYAPMAPQVWKDDPAIELDESEDCLFLNVYTPCTDNEKKPVMFYIHGGAFGIGSGSRPRLYGRHLAEHGDVIVVTIQYRLGPLGFLYMDGIPANLGLKDQICALRWVKDNIAAFGGDPGNITIFGQSAGSISVSYLLVMPEAAGLFQKAIAQSATYPLAPWTLAKAAKLTRLFISKLKVAYGDLESLRQLKWEEIIRAQREITKDILSENHHSPVLDGVSIPKDCLTALETGFGSKIPLMIGHTSDELPAFEGFINSENFVVRTLAKRMLSKRLVGLGLKRETLRKALELYREEIVDAPVPNKEYDLLLTDLGFRLPSIIVADIHSKSRNGTYFYEFAYKAPNLGAAVHVLDLFFIFGTLDTSDISDAMRLSQSEEELTLSRQMQDAWTSFARTGNPSNPNLPEWKEYDSENRFTMILDSKPRIAARHLENRIDIWKSLSLL